jgi:CubicO group peptidase (beta-lactamase class C family)
MKVDWSARAALVWLAFVVSCAAVAQTAPPLPQAAPETVGMSPQRLAKISAALKKEVADGSFRGAVVMVARKGKLVYQEAVGMQSADAPMRADSVFRIYSMTKPIVSVAAMMLVEDGTIQLTDPVGKFLPGFDKMQVSVATKAAEGTAYNNVPAERPMTVQDLLRHTSGLAYGEITQNAPVKEGYEKAGLYSKDLDYEARGMTPAEQIQRLATVPLAFHPGTTWHYSLSSDVLGRVVEAVSGKRLGDFLQERLFR